AYSYVASIDATGKSAFLYRGTPGDPRLFAVTASAQDGSVRRLETTLDVGPRWLVNGSVPRNAFYWFFIDLNGDGNAQALQVPIRGGVPQVAFNTGAGFAPPRDLPGATNDPAYAFPSRQPPPPGNPLPKMTVQVVDTNDDGLPDIVIQNETTGFVP